MHFKLAENFSNFTIKKQEFDEIVKHAKIFDSFFGVYRRRLGENAREKLEDYLYKIYSFDNKGYYPNIYAGNVDSFNRSLYNVADMNIVYNFGCFLLTGRGSQLIFFSMPIMLSQVGLVYVWGDSFLREYSILEQYREFITVLSIMYGKGVPKKDLVNIMSEYFDKEVVYSFFGLENQSNYVYILKQVLEENYNITMESYSHEVQLLKTIYDLWNMLLKSKDMLEIEAVKKLWDMTDCKVSKKDLDAKRELEYISVRNLPSILTYANLYEKGIESDFGQAILKTLENKKEAESLEKTLFPMEKYIAREKGIPYKVPETEKVKFRGYETILDYDDAYQSVLDDIFRKLKAVG